MISAFVKSVYYHITKKIKTNQKRYVGRYTKLQGVPRAHGLQSTMT